MAGTDVQVAARGWQHQVGARPRRICRAVGSLDILFGVISHGRVLIRRETGSSVLAGWRLNGRGQGEELWEVMARRDGAGPGPRAAQEAFLLEGRSEIRDSCFLPPKPPGSLFKNKRPQNVMIVIDTSVLKSLGSASREQF